MTRLGVIVCVSLLTIIGFLVHDIEKKTISIRKQAAIIDHLKQERELMTKSQGWVDSLAFYLPEILRQSSQRDTQRIEIKNHYHFPKPDTVRIREYIHVPPISIPLKDGEIRMTPTYLQNHQGIHQ